MELRERERCFLLHQVFARGAMFKGREFTFPGGRVVGVRFSMVRSRAGQRLASAALIADGGHARADAYVSLGVVASAAVVALGLDVADPLIGLAITAVILRIT